MGSFSGKVAIVTGGTQGIGRASAVAFAREGAKVVVAGRGEQGGQETVALVRQAGGEAIFVRTDVARESDVAALVAATLQQFGRLDFAFNNAGVEQAGQALPEQTEETFDRIMAINVKGVWLCLKHQIPALARTGGGAIVNCSSIAGVVGVPGVEIYAASKHAVIGLTKSTALEVARHNIRVNVVAPGGVETAMIDRYAHGDAATLQALRAAHPMGRMAQPEEIAEAAIWLCSDKSSFITGHTLMADGGYTAQ